MMKIGLTDWSHEAGISQCPITRLVSRSAKRFIEDPACSYPDQKRTAARKKTKIRTTRFFSGTDSLPKRSTEAKYSTARTAMKKPVLCATWRRVRCRSPRDHEPGEKSEHERDRRDPDGHPPQSGPVSGLGRAKSRRAEVLSAEPVLHEAEHHADAGRPEAQVPVDLLAEEPADEGPEERAGVDARVEDREAGVAPCSPLGIEVARPSR